VKNVAVGGGGGKGEGHILGCRGPLFCSRLPRIIDLICERQRRNELSGKRMEIDGSYSSLPSKLLKGKVPVRQTCSSGMQVSSNLQDFYVLERVWSALGAQ